MSTWLATVLPQEGESITEWSAPSRLPAPPAVGAARTGPNAEANSALLDTIVCQLGNMLKHKARLERQGVAAVSSEVAYCRKAIEILERGRTRCGWLVFLSFLHLGLYTVPFAECV